MAGRLGKPYAIGVGDINIYVFICVHEAHKLTVVHEKKPISFSKDVSNMKC